ncbi:MAG: universal stress protein [Gordonia sp. (in: high G+C Gram-positive bacteria)]
MPILVGVDPGRSSTAALDLASLMARSIDTDLVVAVVIGRSWMPSMAKADQEWQDQLRGLADGALERAREALGSSTRASYVVHEASSTRRGLAELAEKHDADFIAIGSAADGGANRTSLGSGSNALLHSSAVPVAIAPAGYAPPAGSRASRVTAAYGGSEDTVTDEWAATIRARADAVLDDVEALPDPPQLTGVEIGIGET